MISSVRYLSKLFRRYVQRGRVVVTTCSSRTLYSFFLTLVHTHIYIRTTTAHKNVKNASVFSFIGTQTTTAMSVKTTSASESNKKT